MTNKTLQDYARWNLSKATKRCKSALTEDTIADIARRLASGNYSSILIVADDVGVDKATVIKYMRQRKMVFNRKV